MQYCKKQICCAYLSETREKQCTLARLSSCEPDLLPNFFWLDYIENFLSVFFQKIKIIYQNSIIRTTLGEIMNVLYQIESCLPLAR